MMTSNFCASSSCKNASLTQLPAYTRSGIAAAWSLNSFVSVVASGRSPVTATTSVIAPGFRAAKPRSQLSEWRPVPASSTRPQRCGTALSRSSTQLKSPSVLTPFTTFFAGGMSINCLICFVDWLVVEKSVTCVAIKLMKQQATSNKRQACEPVAAIRMGLLYVSVCLANALQCDDARTRDSS